MRRLLTALAVTAMIATTAPFGAVSLATTRAPGRAATGAHHRATYQGNKRATRRETRRLLGLAPIPEDATPTDRRDGLDAPAMGSDDSESFTDAHAFWHDRRGMNAVYRQISRERPKGLHRSGSGRQTDRGRVVERGIAWSEPDRRYAVRLALEVSVAPGPDGEGSTVRVDGVGDRLNPRPYRDTTPAAHRMRVTQASGCPDTDRGIASVQSPGSGLTHRLLPARRPTAGVVCVYGGGNAARPFGLYRALRLSADRAARFARDVNRLRIAHIDGGTYSCPMDDGRADAMALAYPGRPDVDVWVPYTGCSQTSNGRIRVDGSPRLPDAWTAPDR